MEIDKKHANRVAAALKGGGGRSDLFRTIRDNFSLFKGKRDNPDWVEVAKIMNGLGLRTSAGLKLKPGTVRRTFARVEAWYDKNPGYEPPTVLSEQEVAKPSVLEPVDTPKPQFLSHAAASSLPVMSLPREALINPVSRSNAAKASFMAKADAATYHPHKPNKDDA